MIRMLSFPCRGLGFHPAEASLTFGSCSSMPFELFSLKESYRQCFSNFDDPTHYLGNLLNAYSDLGSLRWDLLLCISNKLLDVAAGGPMDHTL